MDGEKTTRKWISISPYYQATSSSSREFLRCPLFIRMPMRALWHFTCSLYPLRSPSIHDRNSSQSACTRAGHDLSKVVQTLKKYRWAIACVTAAISMLATLMVFSMTPIYQSTAEIEKEQAKVVSIEEVYGIEDDDKPYLNTSTKSSRRAASCAR